MRPLPTRVNRKAEWAGVSEAVVSRLAEAIVDKAWPIYLHGGTGAGKTCAAALVHCVWPVDSVFIRLDTLTRWVGECRRGEGHTEAEDDHGRLYTWWEVNFWTRVKRAGLVVIDEIGAKHGGGLWQEVLIDVLDYREGLPCICTGNFSIEQLAEKPGEDARYVSRLVTRGGVRINCGEVDRR